MNKLALALRAQTEGKAHSVFESLKQQIDEGSGDSAQFKVEPGGPDHDNSHWYKYDIIESSRDLGGANGDSNTKFINFNENHYFVKSSVWVDAERFLVVVSFHHVGRELTGVMEATAFAKLVSSGEDGEKSAQVLPCTLEPFVFTFRTRLKHIEESYDRWLDQALAIAIKEYADRL